MPAGTLMAEEAATEAMVDATPLDVSLWKVVGGVDKGGIIVRDGQSVTSSEAGRLSTGALVLALERPSPGGRLHYELIKGEGPATGWVSLSVGGKELVVSISGEENIFSSVDISDLGGVDVMRQLAKGKIMSQNALRSYSQSFKKEEVPQGMFNRKAFPWHKSGAKEEKQPGLSEESHAELEQALGVKLPSRKEDGSIMQGKKSRPPQWDQFATERMVNDACTELVDTSTADWAQVTTGKALAEDSDDEQVLLCGQCSLPLGDIAYAVEGSRCSRVHGECMAVCILNEMKTEDKERRRTEKKLKSSRREKYEIGWKVMSVPRNLEAAERMGCAFAPKGMCCITLDPHEVSVLPTTEPVGAVNLEYLSIALKVRRIEGREPFFSLDPKDATHNSMQVKRFEPEWLAGTSVGDVLFQADYHLKELSMGEYEQPVVGMRSCFDFSFEQGHDILWKAREWFIVRKAEIHLSENDVLIPFVRMGVEAWEQIEGPDGQLEDAKVTRKDHPLLLYAQSFTHNFDLIAERKSVVFHLRELAKASVLAKYLVDANVNVPLAWFESTTCCEEASVDPKHLELPQLWNERSFGTIKVQGGEIIGGAKGIGGQTFGVYGGVDFGLDKFNISNLSTRALLEGQAKAVPARRGLLPTSITSPGIRSVRGPVPAPSILNVRAPVPRGVDLDLDKFDLSEATKVSTQSRMLQLGEVACAAIGNEFWPNIDSANTSVFNDDDRLLLANLFNPHMSDRRDEGEQFVPPDTSVDYLAKLSSLMKEEDSAREARKRFFLSKQFAPDNPGPQFPSSWKDYIEIDGAHAGQVVRLPPADTLHERADYLGEAQLFNHVLESAVPVFDKSSEEGMRFRVYELGSIEVRTTQKHNGNETVGVVFSTRPMPQDPTEAKPINKAQDDEQLVKATMYTEMHRRRKSNYRYYLVLDTEAGNSFVTEYLADDTVTWHENPADLEVRNSLARAFRSKDCRGKGVSVRDASTYQNRITFHAKGGTMGKRYAQGVYDQIRGEDTYVAPRRLYSGTTKYPGYASKFQKVNMKMHGMLPGGFRPRDRPRVLRNANEIKKNNFVLDRSGRRFEGGRLRENLAIVGQTSG